MNTQQSQPFQTQNLRSFSLQELFAWREHVPAQADMAETFADSPKAFANCPPPRFGVRLERVTYSTHGANNEELRASGLLMLPEGAAGGQGGLPLLCLLQQTIFDLRDAPSLFLGSRLAKLALPLFAAQGYVVFLPDYIGQGVCHESPHPYMHRQATVRASVDMLTAVRQVARQQGVPLGAQLFASGFSQGGHACLAFVQALESMGLQVTGAAPIAAMVDVERCLHFLARSPLPAAGIIMVKAVLAAYRLYAFSPGLEAVLQPGVHEAAERLLLTPHTRDRIFSELVLPKDQLFRPEFFEALAAGTHPLLGFLRQQNIQSWAVASPLRLYYGTEDQLIEPKNSLDFVKSVQAAGGKAECCVSGAHSHNGCVPLALLATYGWFESLRERQA